MSRLARALSGLAVRGGFVRTTAERERRRRIGWRWPLDDSLLRRLERTTLTAGRAASGGLGGEHRSRARAASTDFVDYRPYLPGDDFRQIDWNAYGRLNQLHVKLTEARERLSLQIVLDCSASMDAGQPSKLDVARQLAAVVGYVALARYDRLDLVRLGGDGPTLRPLRGKARFAELIAALDATSAGRNVPLDDELAGFRPLGPSILISDLLCPTGFERGLDALAGGGFEASLVQVLSPQELAPEAAGDLELEDVESGETVEVGLSGPVIETYRRRLADWCGGVERACAGRGLRYARVITNEPLEQVGLVALRQARILR